MKRTCIFGIVLAISGLIQGCVGYNSVLFGTRSNLGFSYDTAPPSLEVAVSRYEGVIEPTFESGQVVPVMASLSSGASGFRNFFWGVKSAFAAGEAAYTMSYLYEDDTPAKNVVIPYERVTLSQIPAPTPLGMKVKYIEPGKARPVRFATDTTLGIKIRWEGQTAQFPSSANIGYKRKEATWAPIAIGINRKADPKKPYEADTASLLATIDVNVTTPETGTTLQYLQYFATGSAANNLARRQVVRQVMLERLDPVQAQKAAAERTIAASNWDLILQIKDKFDTSDSIKQGKILDEAKRLELVGGTVTVNDFINELAGNERKGPPVPENLNTLKSFALQL